MTESKSAFLNELLFFGFDDVKEDLVVQGTVADFSKVVKSATVNLEDELEALDDRIRAANVVAKDCATEKILLRFAHTLMIRSSKGFPVRIKEEAAFSDAKKICHSGLGKVPEFTSLSEYLERYGLRLVRAVFEDSDSIYNSSFCDFYLENINSKKRVAEDVEMDG
jgi:hypothetical protein